MTKQRVTPQAPDDLHEIYGIGTPGVSRSAIVERHQRKYKARMSACTPDERSAMRKVRGWTEGQIALALMLLPVITAAIGLVVLAIVS